MSAAMRAGVVLAWVKERVDKIGPGRVAKNQNYTVKENVS
jgi:hypothetical protein